MAFSSSQKGLRAELNVTPLIDVVLVLLIVFMVLVPALVLRNPVHLAVEQKSPAVPASEETLELTLSSTGALSAATQPIARDQLRSLVATWVQSHPPTVVVRAAQEVPYGIVMETMDVCRAAGAKTVALLLPDAAVATTLLPPSGKR